MLIKTVSKKPIFSIIIPTFNRPHMIKRAINSICKQTFDDFELIIVNDGSTDDYNEVVSQVKGINIHVITNNCNKGAAEARNIGIEAAKGKYISFIDDDDEYLDSFLESTYQKLYNTEYKVGFSWCGVKQISYSQSISKDPDVYVRKFMSTYKTQVEQFEQLFSIGIGFGFTFKSQCIREIGLFNKNLKAVEDTDIFFRLIIAGYVPVVIPEVHMILHNHNQSRLTDISMHNVRIKECEWLLTEYEDFLNEHLNLKKQLLWQINNLKNELRSRAVCI